MPTSPPPRKSDIILVSQTQDYATFRERRTPRSRKARRAIDLLRVLGFFHLIGFGLVVFMTSFRSGKRDGKYNPVIQDFHEFALIGMVLGVVLILAGQAWKVYLRTRRGRMSLGLDPHRGHGPHGGPHGDPHPDGHADDGGVHVSSRDPLS